MFQWLIDCRIDSYTNYDSMAEDAVDAIEAGLRLKKEKKKQKRNLLPLDGEDDLSSALPLKKKKKIAASAMNSQTEVRFASKLSLLSGNATLQDDGVVGGFITLLFLY